MEAEELNDDVEDSGINEDSAAGASGSEYVPSSCSSDDEKSNRMVKVFIDKTRYQSSPLSGETLLSLTSQCFKYHRLKKSFEMFDVMLSDRRISHELVFKMGSILLQTKAKDETDLEAMREFSGYCFSLNFNRAEIFLEFLLFFLCKWGVLSARRLIESHLKAAENVRNQKCKVIPTLVQCYSGFVSYVQWENTVVALGSRSESIVFENGAEVRVNEVVETFKKVTQIKNGSYDLFVVCLLRMLVYYGRFDEAKEQLFIYKENNPDNVNSYIYLYKYLSKYCKAEIEDVKVECCKKLAELSPSDKLLPQMVEEETVDTVESIKILMEFVDFKPNKNDEKAWKQLTVLLKRLDLGSNNYAKVRDIYDSIYKSYWSLYHFNDRRFNRKESKKLLYSKAIVIAFFEGSSHAFVKLVLNALSSAVELKSSLENELAKCSKP